MSPSQLRLIHQEHWLIVPPKRKVGLVPWTFLSRLIHHSGSMLNGVCVCVCVYVHSCVMCGVCMCACVCVHVHISMHVHMHICICVCVCIPACILVCEHSWTRICMSAFVHLSLCACRHACTPLQQMPANTSMTKDLCPWVTIPVYAVQIKHHLTDFF